MMKGCPEACIGVQRLSGFSCRRPVRNCRNDSRRSCSSFKVRRAKLLRKGTMFTISSSEQKLKYFFGTGSFLCSSRSYSSFVFNRQAMRRFDFCLGSFRLSSACARAASLKLDVSLSLVASAVSLSSPRRRPPWMLPSWVSKAAEVAVEASAVADGSGAPSIADGFSVSMLPMPKRCFNRSRKLALLVAALRVEIRGGGFASFMDGSVVHWPSGGVAEAESGAK
mmetsp:Transcript_23039/g.54759  ORF Transcript_23039/g.54759 Transcript_23039/m.54759 type:complete len:224 (-) Transcript_23039:645-1316(-)